MAREQAGDRELDLVLTDPGAAEVVARVIAGARSDSAADFGIEVVAAAVMAAAGNRRLEFLAAVLEGCGVPRLDARAAALLFVLGAPSLPDWDGGT